MAWPASVDVTQPNETRIESDAEKAAAQDQYRALFERSADAILIIDGDRFIDCNDATVRMLRYQTKTELLQTHPSELSPEFQPDGRRSYDKANEMMAIAFEHGSHRFEWDHRRADGEVFPVEVLLTAVPERDRLLLHVVWRDITERKRLEEDLRHAQKMEAIGRLAGGIAHDFNNLLVAILGYSDLLSSALTGQSELREFAETVKQSAQRAANMTSQLLAFSRKQVLAPEIVDLAAVVDGLADQLRRLIGEHITLVIERSADPATVVADPGQVEQVILNIVANARDAMPDGGTVTIRTRTLAAEAAAAALAPVAHVCLTVTDTGTGMPPETAARAFEPFFTSKERGRGTGLGLASVYGAVKQSGGDVRLQTAVGRGTTIEVLLPFADPAARPRPQREPARTGSAPSRCGQATVLVAEDEPAVAGLVRRVLESRGYRVLNAQNGAAALRLASGSPVQIDAVLTDVVMPGMSGPEMVNVLRRERPDLPVLFMSGYTDDALSVHGFDTEDVDLIRKPFTASELSARIARLLGTREQPE